MCGVELHLPELIESIHQVQGSRIGPYLDRNRHDVCEECAFLHSSGCPCPMDYLAVLVVEAIETVDERHRQRSDIVERTPQVEAADLDEIRRAYREGTGTWTGCDWATHTVKTGLDLKGCTAAKARILLYQAADPQEADDWRLAARWLAHVEHNAQLAECRAFDAVKAAEEGRWRDALLQAEWAWSLEFSTGRALRHAPPLAWERLRSLIEAGYVAQEIAEVWSAPSNF
jgi:hypothetical protein